MNACSYCGHTIEDQADFCGHCGTPLSAQPNEADDSTSGMDLFSTGSGIRGFAVCYWRLSRSRLPFNILAAIVAVFAAANNSLSWSFALSVLAGLAVMEFLFAAFFLRGWRIIRQMLHGKPVQTATASTTDSPDVAKETGPSPREQY